MNGILITSNSKDLTPALQMLLSSDVKWQYYYNESAESGFDSSLSNCERWCHVPLGQRKFILK